MGVKLVLDIKGKKQTDGVQEHGAEGNNGPNRDEIKGAEEN